MPDDPIAGGTNPVELRSTGAEMADSSLLRRLLSELEILRDERGRMTEAIERTERKLDQAMVELLRLRDRLNDLKRRTVAHIAHSEGEAAFHRNRSSGEETT
jgi:hypothetical protein